MKSGKSHIAASLAVQMILIPILLTLGLFAVSGIFAGLLNNSSKPAPGSEALKLIYVLTALFGSLLVGGATGYIFSALSKNTPASAKVRYVVPGLPVVYALLFAVPALLLANGNFNSGWWGAYALKNPTFFVFDFAMAFSGLHFIMPVAELSGYSGFAAGILLRELISGTALRSRPAVRMKAALGILLAVAVVFPCVGSRDVISSGIMELRYGKSTVGNDLTEFDLMNIAPFKEDNGLAKLEGKASLQYSSFDEMPRLDGATAAYPVYAAFVQAVYKGLGDYYEANRNTNGKDIYAAFVASDEYPLNIVKCSKTATAYERLINGQADIIFVAEPSNSQVDMVKAKGDEFVLTPIGSEAFVFFTNIRNPVENLTIKQIQAIYSGAITNWKEVGGANKKILPFQRPEDSGSQTIMQNKVMKGIKMLEPAKETYAGGMGDIISRVAGYKNAKTALGYSFMYYSSSMIRNNQIKYVSVDGIKPTPETVRNETYPFTIPVYAVSLKSCANRNVKQFLDWILSDEGQGLIEKTGYVSIR